MRIGLRNLLKRVAWRRNFRRPSAAAVLVECFILSLRACFRLEFPPTLVALPNLEMNDPIHARKYSPLLEGSNERKTISQADDSSGVALVSVLLGQKVAHRRNDTCCYRPADVKVFRNFE